VQEESPCFLERAKEVLSAEQVERFKQTLISPCSSENRPEAPPAKGYKTQGRASV
jgi:hypothetical protein